MQIAFLPLFVYTICGGDSVDNLLKTPLYPEHVAAGGRIVDFGGWALPVQYSGILNEVEAVRKKAGLFDVSHMGEIWVTGPQAISWLDAMVTNDVSKMVDSQIIYTFLCYPDGGVVDDLLIYRYGQEKFLLVVNASNTQKDWEWLESHKKPGVQLENASPDTAQLAIQGPLALAILQKLTDYDLAGMGYFQFADPVAIDGVPALVSRTGYTGEDGFEIYCRPQDATGLWQKLMAVGQEQGLIPCGLGSRDTLRFEAGLPLYGHEISQEISPLEAKLGYFVKLKKPGDFIGKAALVALKEKGLPRKLVGLRLVEKGVARAEYPVFSPEGEEVGFVTTGSYSPTIDANIANALVKPEFSQEGATLLVGVRKRRLEAKVARLPFYKREEK